MRSCAQTSVSAAMKNDVYATDQATRLDVIASRGKPARGGGGLSALYPPCPPPAHAPTMTLMRMNSKLEKPLFARPAE